MPLAKTPLLAETVRKLVARGAHANAFNILTKLHPSDIANLVTELPENFRKATFELLLQKNLTLAGEALSELGPARGGELLAGMSVQEISRVLQELDPDDAAEFVGQLPPELQEEILGAMRQKDAAEVEDLLQYPEQTAGRIMNPNVFSLHEDTTVGEAIARLQDSGDLEMVFYIYVVDDHNNLVGVLSLRQLLQKRPERRLKDLMVTEVIRASTDTDQEEVAHLVASYNILAIPVVDPQNKLAGFIPVDDVIDVIKEEATEDMYRLAGLDVSERVFSRPRTSVRMRIPWLVVNLATAFLAAIVVSLFEDTISKYAILAVFMPIVAGMGGNAGTQTLTVMVRGIALGELSWSNSRRALLKEMLVGTANGVAIGAFVALVAFLWKGSPMLGLILAVAMAGNLMVAAVAGTLVPLALRWLKVDPALASSVFVTTCTDVFGFLFFLGLGSRFLLS
ncbi:MAG: magnesium transporter [Acidobacteriota bacterium]